MEQGWTTHRTVISRSDGQRRWDYAYQFLLRWAMEQKDDESEPTQKEEHHGNCSLCTCIDQSSTTKPDD